MCHTNLWVSITFEPPRSLDYYVTYANDTSHCLTGNCPNLPTQDGLRLTIQFEAQDEYELDANTLEEKNEVRSYSSAVVGIH